jgi:hypothetical protein
MNNYELFVINSYYVYLVPVYFGYSVVGMATSYGPDGRGVGVRVPVGAGFFSLSMSSRQALRPTEPPIQLVTGVKRAGRERNHSPPTSVEVKNKWTYTSTPSCFFMA